MNLDENFIASAVTAELGFTAQPVCNLLSRIVEPLTPQLNGTFPELCAPREKHVAMGSDFNVNTAKVTHDVIQQSFKMANGLL